MIIAPSVLSADWAYLADELSMCERLGVGRLHIDIMDGHFVPPISFGDSFISHMRKHSKLFFDVHIMVENPEAQVDAMIKAGADALTFHLEATLFSLRLISYIKTQYPNVQTGIAINPQTPVELLAPLLNSIDIVLLMSVEPGYGGQSFIPYTFDKIQALVKMRADADHDFLISIDGGVNKENAMLISEQGADVLVMGSAFFSEKDKTGLLNTLGCDG